MEMEQMMACLLVEIRTGQEQMKREVMDANLKEITAKIDTNMKNNQEMLAKVEANEERMKDSLREDIKSGQTVMRSTVSALAQMTGALITGMKDGRKERTACQVTTEAWLECKEPTSVNMAFEAEHQVFPKEAAAVRSSKAMKKRYRGRNVATEHHQKPKERTSGNCGSLKKLTVINRKMI
jgi:hypothetical protein